MTTVGYAAAFVAGARWWAERRAQRFRGAEFASIAAEQNFAYDSNPGALLRGSWPIDHPARAFADGARWQECEASGGSMWATDRAIAAEEAERWYPPGEVYL